MVDFKKVNSEFTMMNSLNIFINFLSLKFPQRFWIRIIYMNWFWIFFMIIFQMYIWSMRLIILLNTFPMMFFFFRKITIDNVFIILYLLYQLPIILINILNPFLLLFNCNGLINSIVNILFKFLFLFSLKSIYYFYFIIEFY